MVAKMLAIVPHPVIRGTLMRIACARREVALRNEEIFMNTCQSITTLKPTIIKACAWGAALMLALPTLIQAQAAGPDKDAEDLAKQLSNPVADLVSVPLQFNWDNGVGPSNDDENMRFILNFQPVVPFKIAENWSLIGRFIVPYLNQPVFDPNSPAVSGESGTGDILASAFISPSKPTWAIWGIGPAMGLPTTTNPFLGSGKWTAGPTVVILKQAGHWTYGGLANHLWSYADTGDLERADVSQSYVQPFLSYTTKSALTLGVSSESSYNWEADSGEKWTAPLLGNVSKVTRFGPFPFSMGVGGGYYFEHPEVGPQWKLRLTFTLILPKAK